jgi:hypothetical protein
MRRAALAAVGAAGVGGAGCYLLVGRGIVTIDLGIGRSLRPLGPVSWTIGAQPETVFDVIAAPYLGRTPRAMRGKLAVWERGSDMVLAAHFTPVCIGTSATVETVRFERPRRIDFRVVRGPVPHVTESYLLESAADGTSLTWQGELGTDLWALGRWWARRVVARWEQAVSESIEAIRAEAERRAHTEPR